MPEYRYRNFRKCQARETAITAELLDTRIQLDDAIKNQTGASSSEKIMWFLIGAGAITLAEELND